MDEQTARGILECVVRWLDCSYTDWGAFEEYIENPAEVPNGYQLAAALAFLWTKGKDEPGFNQPSRNLVDLVEHYIGEDDPFNWSEALAAQA
jgi:hypothetical protein